MLFHFGSWVRFAKQLFSLAVGSFCKITFFARAGGSMNVGVVRRAARRGAKATGLDGRDAESLASSGS